MLLQNETNNYLSNLSVDAFNTFYIYNKRSKGLIHPISYYFEPNCKNFYENSKITALSISQFDCLKASSICSLASKAASLPTSGLVPAPLPFVIVSPN